MMIEAAAAPGTRASADATTVHVAIVHVPGFICHVVAAASADGVIEKLGDYVAEHCGLQLDEPDALRVRQLLARGNAAAAVECYFSRVGARWDVERLTAVELDLGSSGAGSVSARGLEPAS